MEYLNFLLEYLKVKVKIADILPSLLPSRPVTVTISKLSHNIFFDILTVIVQSL